MDDPCPLCDRELELLALYSSKQHCKQMADSMGITINTLYTHQRSILRKMKEPTIAHAVATAKDKKWI